MLEPCLLQPCFHVAGLRGSIQVLWPSQHVTTRPTCTEPCRIVRPVFKQNNNNLEKWAQMGTYPGITIWTFKGHLEVNLSNGYEIWDPQFEMLRVRVLPSFQQPAFQSLAKPQCLCYSRVECFLCFKWMLEMWVVMIVSPPYECCGLKIWEPTIKHTGVHDRKHSSREEDSLADRLSERRIGPFSRAYKSTQL